MKPARLLGLSLAGLLLSGCGAAHPMSTQTKHTKPQSASSHQPVVVWNRSSPLRPPALAEPKLEKVSLGSPKYRVTDEFRFDGVTIAAGEDAATPSDGVLIFSRKGKPAVHALPPGSGGAVITSWNGLNAQGQPTVPSVVYFATLHGVSGQVQIQGGQVQVAPPALIPYQADQHVPAVTWSDGNWYDVKTGLFGPRFVYTVGGSDSTTVVVLRRNATANPETDYHSPAGTPGLRIRSFDAGGNEVTLQGPGGIQSLDLTTGRWSAGP